MIMWVYSIMQVLVNFVVIFFTLLVILRAHTYYLDTDNVIVNKAGLLGLLYGSYMVIQILYKVIRGCNLGLWVSSSKSTSYALVGVLGYSLYIDFLDMYADGLQIRPDTLVYHAGYAFSAAFSVFLYQAILLLVRYNDICEEPDKDQY